jgi:ribonucleoside-diphosphate reductase alpha chain
MQFDYYQQYIHLSRYARWNDKEKRRETWPETVNRYLSFFVEHLKENHDYDVPFDTLEEVREAILNMEVMPSMRAMWTAGPALKRDNIAGYNCAYIPVNRVTSFDEILYLLMNGTGVGFSVERQYVAELPVIAESFHPSNITIVVEDSKSGWSKALKELVHLLYAGQIPSWDTTKVRPAGAQLKTFGGRASGPEPLEDLFKFAVTLFKNAAGRKLSSIECHDLVCKIADIVVVGGVRRSALISLSNLSDDRMRYAKSGQWWETQPQRQLANNSTAYTEKPEPGIFMKEWLALYESKSGERGIFNRQAAKKKVASLWGRDPNHDFGVNPCVVGETIITIMRTDGSIEDIDIASLEKMEKEDIKVFSRNTKTGKNEFKLVTDWAQTHKRAKIIRVTDEETGVFIECTPDHLVFTKNRGYVAAKDLAETDVLLIEK